MTGRPSGSTLPAMAELYSTHELALRTGAETSYIDRLVELGILTGGRGAQRSFSPTDVPVLSRWAKVLMMVQASISLATIAILAARAVNIL